MSRFYIKRQNIKGKNIFINGDEAHHILDVMRLKNGNRIVAFDGQGNEYEGIIKDTKKTELLLEIINVRNLEPVKKLNITLVQAIPKKAKIDFIIEKAVELGVDTIIPMRSSRTIVKFDKEKKESRYKRWQRITLSASKQCGALSVPIVYPVAEFGDIVKKAKAYDLAIMPCLYKETQGIKKVIRGFTGKTILVFIGPEGDFAEGEIKTAKNEGCKLVSLGCRVLRADTAAINALSILQYELG